MEERKSVAVAIKVKTEVYQQEEFKEYFFEVEGQMVRIGEVLYLRYEEIMEGIDTPIPVTLKILPDGEVTLIRAGEVRMKLQFAYQERKETQYSTPFGMMSIMTETNKIRVSLKDKPDSGRIQIDYDLFAGDEKLGVYHLDIEFTS